MKKIGICTIYTGYNYGSALQAFATKIILKKLGYEPEILKLSGSLIKGRDVRIKKILIFGLRRFLHLKSASNSYKAYKNSPIKKLTSQSKELFDIFYESYIDPYIVCERKVKRLSRKDEYIAFICGSDQIWNSEALYVDPFYYLRFAPECKRIAFAPSFGRDYIAKYNLRLIKKYVSGIPNLSVREESGVKIIADLIGRSSVQLIDPTLVLTASDWDQCLNLGTNCDQDFILAYFLNEPSEKAKRFIEQLAHNKHLKVIVLPYERDEKWGDETPSAGPLEFVQYVKNANYICTDSFHGTAFAINFGKPFFTFDRQYGVAKNQTTRIISLLKLLSLEKRFEPSFEHTNFCVDYTESYKVLNNERKKAIDYLTHALNVARDI